MTLPSLRFVSWCVPLFLAAACALEPDPADPGRTQQAIRDGNTARVELGGVLVIGGPRTCSGVLIEPNLVLTHAQCVANREVTDGTSTVTVRLARVVPGSSELVTLQLHKALDAAPRVLAALGATRESLICYGFDATGTFTSGGFSIVDLNGTTISLADRYPVDGTTTIEDSDVGGFCLDHNNDVVAILTGATNFSGVATATTVDAVIASHRDLVFSLEETVNVGAVTLVDDPGVVLPNVLGVIANGTVRSEVRAAGATSQGFYFVEQGTLDVVLLLNAATSQCLVVSGSSVRSTSCSKADLAQQWWVERVQVRFSNGFTDGYRVHVLDAANGQCLSRQGGLGNCQTVATLFGFWLNWF